jgi:hypothetical protein
MPPSCPAHHNESHPDHPYDIFTGSFCGGMLVVAVRGEGRTATSWGVTFHVYLLMAVSVLVWAVFFGMGLLLWLRAGRLTPPRNRD